VTKIADPQKMCIEIEKSIKAYDIGVKSGLFYVPKVLDYNTSKGLAVFERINNLHPVIDHLKDRKKFFEVVELAGRAISVVHEELTLPINMTIELPAEFKLHGQEVYFHGDFNGRNVCSIQGKTSLVILDWQMTSMHGGEATYGTRYFDLAWFINYFIWKPSLKSLLIGQIKKATDIFLTAYFKNTKSLTDTEEFLCYLHNFLNIKIYLWERKGYVDWNNMIFLRKAFAKSLFKYLESAQIK